MLYPNIEKHIVYFGRKNLTISAMMPVVPLGAMSTPPSVHTVVACKPKYIVSTKQPEMPAKVVESIHNSVRGHSESTVAAHRRSTHEANRAILVRPIPMKVPRRKCTSNESQAGLNVGSILESSWRVPCKVELNTWGDDP